MQELTQETLHTFLDYSPELGVFTWRVPRRGSAKAGTVAGSVDTKGRRQIKVLGAMHFAHRLAFLWMTGSWPKDQVDHIDRNSKNNRWSNLREATGSQNSINRVSTRTTLPKGVYGLQSGRFYSVIGKAYLGSFDTIEEAERAFANAAHDRDQVFVPPELKRAHY